MQLWKPILGVLVLTALIAMPPQRATAQGAPPYAGGAAAKEKPSPKTTALQKKAEQLSAQYQKKPNPKLKMQLAQAWYAYGHARMYDNALSPRQKYRPALKAFREALKYNPGHKQAKAEKQQIEQIYERMGMPIPQ